MKLIDNIVSDWSYQCENGSPAVKSQADINILKKILENEYKWKTLAIKEFIDTLQLNDAAEQFKRNR